MRVRHARVQRHVWLYCPRKEVSDMVNQTRSSKRKIGAVRWRLMSLLVCLASCLLGLISAGMANADGELHPATDYPKTVDPWEVILYEHPNYTGMWISYKMEAGMRQRLVPQLPPGLEDKVSSIQVGSNVGVTVFVGRNFYAGSPDDYDDFRGSIPHLGVKTKPINDKISSLIIYPQEADGPLGAWLFDLRYASALEYNADPWALQDVVRELTSFPLPEWEDVLEQGWGFLGQFNLDKNANGVGFPIFLSSRISQSIQVVLYEGRNFQGTLLTLPGAEGWRASVDNLGKYGWSDRAASLKVRWTGPPLRLGPPIPRATAPPAPSSPNFTTKMGMDLPGQDYNKFMMKDGPAACEKACENDPKCLAYTWVRPGVKGVDAACCLKSGVPVATQDPNCISGVRVVVAKAKVQGPPTEKKESSVMKKSTGLTAQKSASAVATASKIPNVSGLWKSSIGLVYDITQQGNRFEWTVTTTKEKGQGLLNGNDLSASWQGKTGSGSAKGKITAIDVTGKPTQIDWNNGVRFFR